MRSLNLHLIVVLIGVSAGGCQLFANFDRDKIPKAEHEVESSTTGTDAGKTVKSGGAPGSADCDATDDGGCNATCGNGVIDPGETCDPIRSCPTSCDDGDACTVDTMSGAAETCDAACEHRDVTDCQNGDGCCPEGCNSADDTDCMTTCGNGLLEPGEICETTRPCPTDCNDGNSCTVDTLTGSAATCNAVCSHQLITKCYHNDGCCPVGCTANNDADCTTTCDNGVLEPGETCDPPSACMTSCEDGNACTINIVTGSSANCNAACSAQMIILCGSKDGCCPAGCNANNDDDCSSSCGNGLVEPGETCDPPASCPTSCNDGNSCTIDTLTGSAANCNAVCGHQAISQCANGDGCCPAGCNANNDNNCSASCGNGVVESGETCDPQGSCPTSCSDGTSCTIDTMTGSASNCNVACSNQAIKSCTNGDSCCPLGCNIDNDNDCSASCGDGVITSPETCDPPALCPRSCDDGIACTIDEMTGSADNCNVTCSHQKIISCEDGDGCCPAGCSPSTDKDCPSTCGNNIIEPGETCDPPSSCPTSCNDSNTCTIDTLTGSTNNCNAVCSHQGITECVRNDGCCPPGCVEAKPPDNDCRDKED